MTSLDLHMKAEKILDDLDGYPNREMGMDDIVYDQDLNYLVTELQSLVDETEKRIREEMQDRFDYIFEHPLIEAPVLRADNTCKHWTEGFEAAKNAILQAWQYAKATDTKKGN